MPEDKSRDIVVGDKVVTIQPLRGFKAVKAGQIIGSAAHTISELVDAVADYRAAYAERHPVTINRELNSAHGYGYPDEAFDEKGELTLPGNPNDNEVLLAVFPNVMDMANEQLIDLLALMLAPNDELRKAFDDGDVEPVLKAWRGRILYDMDMPQIVELAGKVGDVLRDELTGLGDSVGKLAALWRPTPQPDSPDDPTTDTSPPRTSSENDESEREPEPTTLTDSSPTSSTDSPTATDGEPSTPSLAATGAPSSPVESG